MDPHMDTIKEAKHATIVQLNLSAESTSSFLFSSHILLSFTEELSNSCWLTPATSYESHGSTTNEYRDEASFPRPMSKQERRSESSDEARPCYDQKHDINQ
ncbi:hypothetical protein FHG87_002736 [Trinorchestia longiramus]|nr:hypothetical protein FHG87_002736 [Trinorchestia longiramus]